MKSYIADYNQFQEKIFKELIEWQKYLNLTLSLPSSSNKSIFKNTTFVGDYSPANKKVIYLRYKSFDEDYDINDIGVEDQQNIQKFNDDDELLKNIQKINDDIENIPKFNDDDRKLLKIHNIDLSASVIGTKDRISFVSCNQNDIITEQNKTNLNCLYYFCLFYNYSYCIFISFLYSYFYDYKNKEKDNDEKNKYYSLFGLFISFPYFGNIISQIYFGCIIKSNFKSALFLSMFFSFLYYLIVNNINLIDINNREKFYPYFLLLLFFSRLCLGLSPFKSLCKEYINNYIPLALRIRCNQKYLLFKYIGYFLGFLFTGINDIIISYSNFSEDIKRKNILLIISSVFFIIISAYSFVSFKNPSNKKFKMSTNLFNKYKRNNMITNIVELEQDEKEKLAEQDINFAKANKMNKLAGNDLEDYSIQVGKKRKAYLNKIFTFLIILLITSQFTAENCIIFLSINNINNLDIEEGKKKSKKK